MHPYFFLKTRTFLGDQSWAKDAERIAEPDLFIPDLSLELIKDKKSIYVRGSSDYINK